MTPNRNKVAKTRNEELIARYQAGESIDALASAYGLSPATVYHIIVRIKRTSISGTYATVGAREDDSNENS